MRYFAEAQGPDWTNKKAQSPEPNFNEHHVHVSEIINQNGEKISLGGEETQTILDPEQGDLKTVTRDVTTPLACGCLPAKDMKIRVFPTGEAVCENHYMTCSLCSMPILPNMHSFIPIDGGNKIFHRHPCSEYVLRQLLQNEQTHPTMPPNTVALLQNMYQDIRASRSAVYRFFTGRRSNNGLLQ